MTELQKTELAILKAVIDICDRAEIRYYMVCGSALGAAKYQGFIPWDDDVDIGIFREDYERFCEIAPQLLPPYYFLQTYKTDSRFPTIFAKVRDVRTTYVEKSLSELNVNHGVYIDVFPLDGYPAAKGAGAWLEFRKKLYTLQLSCVYRINPEQSFKSKCFFRMERMLGFHKRTGRTLRRYERLIAKYSVNGSELICNHGNWQGRLEYAPQWHYGDGVWATFEGLRVRIPENFDAYLTQKYGDWRAELPPEQQVGHHYYAIMDLNRPYTEYVEILPNGKARIKT